MRTLFCVCVIVTFNLRMCSQNFHHMLIPYLGFTFTQIIQRSHLLIGMTTGFMLLSSGWGWTCLQQPGKQQGTGGSMQTAEGRLGSQSHEISRIRNSSTVQGKLLNQIPGLCYSAGRAIPQAPTVHAEIYLYHYPSSTTRAIYELSVNCNPPASKQHHTGLTWVYTPTCATIH